MTASALRLTSATVNLDALRGNLRLLQAQAPGAALWPVIKANAYGHGAQLIGQELDALGTDTVCVADVSEAVELRDAGVRARILTLSATLPQHAEALVAAGCEPTVSDATLLAALDREAQRQARQVALHIKVDTGMGRVGIAPEALPAFVARCRSYPTLQVRGLMSHLAAADVPGSAETQAQLERFQPLAQWSRQQGIPFRHLANSAGLLDWPAAHLDAVRPGLAIYGLLPAPDLRNPVARQLRPVLRWGSTVVFLKEVPPGQGLSYGHSHRTTQSSLIATVAVGYGDGLFRGLSNRGVMLVQGQRCPIVGRITMDMTLLDVSALRGRVALGDEALLLGTQDGAELRAQDLADLLDTIPYEIVTNIAARVPRRIL